ncbi:MAG: dCTP diphosphatase [Thermoproteota archaeon]|jgi:dCTP diphosphatase
MELKKILTTINKFADDRDWKKFHTPKNLSMALSVEISELMEIFQWLNQDESLEVCNDKEVHTHIKEEIADIMIYALRFCHIAGINPIEAMEEKIVKNAIKYPVEKSKGNALKYTKLKKEGTDE